jgi:predicted metal-binding membrane protein
MFRTKIGTQRNFLLNEEYAAQFGIGQKLFSVLLAFCSVILATGVWIRPEHAFLKLGVLPLAAIMVVYAYRVLFTRVMFYSREMLVSIAPFVNYTQSYASVSRIRAQRGNLELTFSGGRKLNIWLGLGKLSSVLAILSDRTDILPEL